MTRLPKRKMSDKETLILGAVCMSLSTALFLTLTLAFSREATEHVQAVKTEMTVLARTSTAAVQGRSSAGAASAAVPARMQALVADRGSAEMELRYRRGIAMVVSMVAGMGIFLAMRELRTRPIGPVLFAQRRGEAA